ncbi:dienelactone hydrolase family protein [Candidatus Babeliales bacterium]|nr:dienelactone hydrolase family protein [Candidatus Babeliales bacterium]
MPKVLKLLLWTLSIITILTGSSIVYLLWLQPAFYFPKPEGRYAVGTKLYHWIDTRRKEILHQDKQHPHRELNVKIWYPAQEYLQNAPTTPYAPYAIDYFKKKNPFAWLLILSRPTYVYAIPDLPIATDESTFPVILFSPGFRGFQDSNTAQCESLASHGYVVVGITHPYDNTVVKFSDDRIADGLKSLSKRSQGIPLEQSSILDDSATIWLADIEFVLNKLEQLKQDNNSFLYKRLDLNHIGMFGHSMGGSTALQIAAHDSRIKAAVNLDGALFGYNIAKKIDKPCMVLLAGNGVTFNERPLTQNEWKRYNITSQEEEAKLKESYLPALDKLAQSTHHNFYTFVVKNAGHLDFSDMALSKSAAPLVHLIAMTNSSLLRLGSINGEKVTEIVNAYLLSFFNKYLKKETSALLDSQDGHYAEIETRNKK